MVRFLNSKMNTLTEQEMIPRPIATCKIVVTDADTEKPIGGYNVSHIPKEGDFLMINRVRWEVVEIVHHVESNGIEIIVEED